MLALCALPLLLNVLGVDFSSSLATGAHIHTILEWTSFCISLCTIVFAFTHYSVKRDVTTPIVATALFLSGMIDAFQILAVNGIVEQVTSRRDFVFFVWFISRTFNVCILIAGTAPFLWKRLSGPSQLEQRGMRFMLLVGVLFCLMAYSIIHIFAALPVIPTTVRSGIIPRPWDIIPLILYLIAGVFIFPRFYWAHPNLFAHALVWSIVPQVIAQFSTAFGATQLYDNNFNVAYYMKIVAQLVPLGGLLLDYTRAYKMEITLRTTEEKLRVARDVQQGLFPNRAPQIPGYQLAGYSYPADVVGGDYFDYIPMQNDELGVVVADVSGHEVGASILMAQTRAYLRALALKETDLPAIATQLNRFLAEDVQKRWFVTLFLIRLNSKEHTFQYTAAGHESYLYKSNGEIVLLESTSPPLGVMEDGLIECADQQQLEPGDILLLMTDGITEALSPDREQFGLSRVHEIVQEKKDRTALEIVYTLYDEVVQYRQDMPQQDDMTMVVLKRTV